MTEQKRTRVFRYYSDKLVEVSEEELARTIREWWGEAPIIVLPAPEKAPEE